MSLIRLVCLVGLTLGAGAESRVAQAVDPLVFRAHLEFLADDALEGRPPGTRGGITAAKYIASQFERLGLEPAGDSGSYFQGVPIIALTPQPSLAVGGPQGAPLAWKDFVLWSMRNDSLVSLHAEPVFVGYGIVAPEYGWNVYAGADVKGKIAVTLTNDPGLRDWTIFRHCASNCGRTSSGSANVVLPRTTRLSHECRSAEVANDD
jgi:hypothetical protein